MTETIVEKQGEFAKRVHQQVQWHTVPIRVLDIKTHQTVLTPLNLPLVIEFDIRKILEDFKKEVDHTEVQELRDVLLKWLGTE